MYIEINMTSMISKGLTWDYGSWYDWYDNTYSKNSIKKKLYRRPWDRGQFWYIRKGKTSISLIDRKRL